MCNQFRPWFLVIFAISVTQAGAQGKVYEDLDVLEFRDKLQAAPEAVLIDLRTPKEAQKGIIERAEILDYYADNFEEQIGRLDREKPYFLYCAAGGRSGEALEIMKELGFTEVYNLSGGYKGWVKAKMPVILPAGK